MMISINIKALIYIKNHKQNIIPTDRARYKVIRKLQNLDSYRIRENKISIENSNLPRITIDIHTDKGVIELYVC